MTDVDNCATVRPTFLSPEAPSLPGLKSAEAGRLPQKKYVPMAKRRVNHLTNKRLRMLAVLRSIWEDPRAGRDATFLLKTLTLKRLAKWAGLPESQVKGFFYKTTGYYRLHDIGLVRQVGPSRTYVHLTGAGREAIKDIALFLPKEGPVQIGRVETGPYARR